MDAVSKLLRSVSQWLQCVNEVVSQLLQMSLDALSPDSEFYFSPEIVQKGLGLQLRRILRRFPFARQLLRHGTSDESQLLMTKASSDAIRSLPRVCFVLVRYYPFVTPLNLRELVIIFQK
jgi:hypothetical protein